MDKSLDISDYNLDDILKLFRIQDKCINEETVKQAKKITMMTHPDKSGKPPEIFIFFSKAYQILLDVYKLSTRKPRVDEEYDDVLPKQVINKLLETDNFNELFNEMWNNASVVRESDGHGDWLSSDSDIYGNDDKSAESMRQQLRHKQLAVYKEPIAMCDYFGCELDGSSSSSGGRYEDIRKAYTETIVGVSPEDYNNKKRYNNVDELVRDRSMNEHMGSDHHSKLSKMKYHSDQDNTRVIYEIVKQDEHNRKFIDKAVSHMLRIGN